VAQAPAGVLVGTPSARTETKDADGARFYSRWWFWTAIGVVVSTGIVVGGILAARPDVAPIYMGQDGAPLLDPKIVKIPSE
jgi:hypothetical protein